MSATSNRFRAGLIRRARTSGDGRRSPLPRASPSAGASFVPVGWTVLAGRSRTSECFDTPSVRFDLGRTLATRLMVAGKEIAVQEMKRNAPPMTAGQAATTATRANPAMATRLKMRSVVLAPRRSVR